MAKYNITGGKTYYLASSIGSTDTTIVLTSFKEPVSDTAYTVGMINSDIIYATIAPKTENTEFISFTGITQNADGTATLTGVTRGLSRSYPYTASSTFKKPHSGQTQFILSNPPQHYQKYCDLENAQTISGEKTFSTFPITPSEAPDADYEVANKKYVDDTITGGVGTASTTNAGTVEQATGTEVDTDASVGSVGPLFIDPETLANSKYGTRLPSSDEKDALAGTGTPSASNKFATADYPIPITYLDTTITLGTSDVKVPTQKAVKTYIDKSNSGSTTKNSADASTTQNIAHGLGRIPRIVRIRAVSAPTGTGTGACYWAETVYNGTTQTSQSIRATNAAPDIFATTFSLNASTSNLADQTGVVTFDATNIIITWTKTNSPSGTYQIMWEAQ